jgi:hypothetical protein
MTSSFPCGKSWQWFEEQLEANPLLLERAQFAPLIEDSSSLRDVPLQSWPVLIDLPERDEIARIATGVTALIRSLPRRIFDSDPEALQDYYNLDTRTSAVVATLLAETLGVEGALTRGDFLSDGATLLCMEVNGHSNLGGYEVASYFERYRAVPLLQSVLSQASGRVVVTDPLVRLMRFLGEQGAELTREEPLNVALVVAIESRSPGDWNSFATASLRRAIGTERAGWARVCEYRDLERRSGGLYWGHDRVHVVVETLEGYVDPVVFRSWLAREIKVFNGPFGAVLGDKRNLALLSELSGDRSLFSPAEALFIDRHVPWSRVVESTHTTFEGERWWLPDLLERRRLDLVLKPARGARGVDVALGANVTEADWSQLSARALTEPGWVVQQRIAGRPLSLQQGSRGGCLHDVVWGLFSIGEDYGGGFLRMMPTGGTGVINACQGAVRGLFLEVHGEGTRKDSPELLDFGLQTSSPPG